MPVNAVPTASDAGIPAVGSITTRPVRRYAPPPFYPPAAKAAQQQGRVLLNVDVDAAGNVTGVAVKQSSGFPLLDEAAMQAVRVWKFEPARTNGAAVPSRTEQSIEFKPPPAGPPAVAFDRAVKRSGVWTCEIAERAGSRIVPKVNRVHVKLGICPQMTQMFAD